MELAEAMRTTGTCRYFEDRQVSDEVLYTAFDHARFGPQGGNRQPVRWIVVRDPERKKALAELYLPPWKAYLAGIGIGDVRVGACRRRWSPPTSSPRTSRASRPSSSSAPSSTGCTPPTTSSAGSSVVGGCSIYPTMQNFCLGPA